MKKNVDFHTPFVYNFVFRKQIHICVREGFLRKTIENQLTFGAINISQIKFNLKCRDDVPQILRGLQHLYMEKETREKIFHILESRILSQKNKRNGRPGMELWKILVMGTLRLNLNWNYDRLHEMVNSHTTIREMLGHGLLEKDRMYNLQTLKDNVKLLTPEILFEINKVAVESGHALLKKRQEKSLKAKCDSFVVKTNVHFPTDSALLFDATRKVIQLTTKLCESYDVSGWRQSDFNIRSLKKQMFRLQKLRRSNPRDRAKALAREREVKKAHEDYTKAAEAFIEKAKKSEKKLLAKGATQSDFTTIHYFIEHAERQIDQMLRRVVNEEIIQHDEKVFSVFEEHTEWICKGKAGVPVELGLRVAIVEDQHGFILNQMVMQKQTDDKVAIPLIESTVEKFSTLDSCSFDKGFHSPANQEGLRKILKTVILPKKGRLSRKDQEHQSSKEFRKAKKQHSAVESAINALEVHGLDRCPDHGLEGFKRYVGLAVFARNVQIIGSILLRREARKRKRKRQNDSNANRKSA